MTDKSCNRIGWWQMLQDKYASPKGKFLNSSYNLEMSKDNLNKTWQTFYGLSCNK